MYQSSDVITNKDQDWDCILTGSDQLAWHNSTLNVDWASPVAQTVKNLSAVQEIRSDPWVRKIPWRREWQPTPVSCLENPMDRGVSWATVSPWGHRTEQLTHTWYWLSSQPQRALKIRPSPVDARRGGAESMSFLQAGWLETEGNKRTVRIHVVSALSLKLTNQSRQRTGTEAQSALPEEGSVPGTDDRDM